MTEEKNYVVPVYHVLSAVCGEQRFEPYADEPETKAMQRALDHISAIVASGHPVTIWRTLELREKQ